MLFIFYGLRLVQSADIPTIVSCKHSNHIFHYIFLHILTQLQNLDQKELTGMELHILSYIDTEYLLCFQSVVE